jgi:hypothetical protein
MSARTTNQGEFAMRKTLITRRSALQLAGGAVGNTQMPAEKSAVMPGE